MSGKRAKQERKEAKEVIAEYTIRAFKGGGVEINGPCHNFLMFRQIMNQAEQAVLQNIIQQQQSRIIQPRSNLIPIN